MASMWLVVPGAVSPPDFLCLGQILAAAIDVPIIWAMERQTSAVIPSPKAGLCRRAHKLPSNLISLAFYI